MDEQAAATEPTPAEAGAPPSSVAPKLFMATIAGAPALVLTVMALVGWSLPREHESSRSADLETSVQATWKVISDLERQSDWRPEVQQVVRVRDESGKERWREIYKGGDRIVFETVESLPNRRLVRRTLDDRGSFSGEWVLALEARGTGCRLTVTERGSIGNPVYRFVTRYIIGHTAQIDLYLASLRKRMRNLPG